MSREQWADVSNEGELLIDWEEAIANAEAFDSGARDYDAGFGKLIIMVQRMSFERGFKEGIDSKDNTSNLLSLTCGNA
jgi:hypothetical protein